MTKALLSLTLLLISLVSTSQSHNQKLIELGKAYKNFMFRNEPPKEVLQDLKEPVPADLKTASAFILQTITTKNKLLTEEFLSRPDDETLKQIYMIRAVNYNLREENQVDNNVLIDSLNKVNITVYEMIDCYYGMLFTAVGNKNQPFNLSKTNFALKDYKFRDETEKGIFVLRCMKDCNTVIWGYMNVVNPPNTAKAYEHIKKFPKFEGQPYYQYNDLYFPDFEMSISKDKGMESYKGFYLDKFFETLVFHLVCINKEGGSEKERNDILLGSILKEKNLYKYTKYKETLETLFKEQKK